jgi:hypothetical protein
MAEKCFRRTSLGARYGSAVADDVPVSEIVYRDEEMFVLRQDCVDRVDFYAQASSAQMLAIVRVSFNAQAVTNIESHEFPFDGEPGGRSA